MNKSMRKNFIIFTTFLCFCRISGAQIEEDPSNKGLSEPQPVITLPKSRCETAQAVLKEKTKPISHLVQTEINEWKLVGGWEMISAEQLKGLTGKEISDEINTGRWYNATVPGTVLTTLVEQGVYPDPLWGLNNLSIPDSLS